METAKLRIITDNPPPKIVLQVALEALADSPIESVVPPAKITTRRGRHLDVDGILARSLPKVSETLKSLGE
jgi:hypothetical protein